jgi:adenosylcobyric acid synthase
MVAKCIMFQGTASHVGKSILATGLCRLFSQEGFRVAPFKSQNITLNSYLTADGGEIGIAQGLQAEAASIRPAVEMNPILLQLKKGMAARVIVMGRPLGEMNAWEYRESYFPRGLEVIKKALEKLRRENEILVIEGAGSPVEVNLKEKDLANMKVASLADSPVILIADIDRGGAFAALIGTLELLEPKERAMVAGFIINKFRGEPLLLQPALDFLEERTGLPVLGVIPFMENLEIDEEDSRFFPGKEKSPEEEVDETARRRKREESYDRLADMLRKQLNLKRLYAIMGF